MNIIAKLSFWIMKPKKEKKRNVITKLSFKKVQPVEDSITFEDLILDGLAQFRKGGYVEKLKTRITPKSLPSDKDDLLQFLYNQIAYT